MGLDHWTSYFPYNHAVSGSGLIGMLLVSRSGLVEVFHHYGVHLPSALLMQIFSWLAGLCYYGDNMEEYRRLCIWLIVAS